VAKREKGGFWLALAVAIFYPVYWTVARKKECGQENIPAEGPALLVMNHISYIDPIFDAVFTHKAGRIPRFLAKNTLWDIKALKGMLVGTGQIPVFRGGADAKESLRAAHEGLAAGKVIVIYPEGTISRDPDWWPMNSRTGIARLALGADVPVIPAARFGTQELYNRYEKKFTPFPRKTVVTRAGEPIDLSAYRGQEMTTALLREVTDLIMTKVRDELAIVRGEPAPAEFYTVPKNGDAPSE
jgi:1-acyl-sn-glycerol-3-phosphate acyltransferase